MQHEKLYAQTKSELARFDSQREEERQLLEWKLKKAEQIAENFKQNKWTTWNGEAKAEMIFEAVKTIRAAIKSGHCEDKTSEQIFNEVKSPQGKTLNEALGWQRFGSLVCDENREPTHASKEFRILNAVFK